MPSTPSLSVVIPVYNSEKILIHLMERLETSLPKLTDLYEVILVNDGSRDGSWQVIEELAGRNAWVVGIDMMRNFGQHNALLCGIRASSNDIIITMDDDLQHPPEEIGLLLPRLADGYDVVYGTPRNDRHNIWRNIFSKTTKLVIRQATGMKIAPAISSFRAIRREVCRVFDDYKSYFVLIDVILAWGTTKIATVEVQHEARISGKSTYTFKKLVFHMLNLITGFSDIPLRLASYLGFIFSLFGGIVLASVLLRYFIEGGVVAGFPFLASTIAIFSGVQLFSLGIIGEYLGRIYNRTMDRPSYVVRNTIKNTNHEWESQ